MSEPAHAIHRFRAAAPAGAAALAIVVAVVGGTVLTRKGPAPEAAQPVADLSAGAPPAAASPNADPGMPVPPGVAFDQAPPAGRPALGVEIVVKFKDDKKIQDMLDLYWKDAAAARKRFDAFKAGRPEFAGVQLDRVTYSNELVLSPVGDVAPDKRAAAARDLAARIGKAPDISYAEANVTAKPGVR